MSVLSESLENFIKRKGVSIAELAKRCRIDRSTMYQYIHGKRPLQNRELLETIIAVLRLTPEEQLRVMQAFEITQIGKEQYYRRKKVKEIFSSLLALEEVNLQKALWENTEIPGVETELVPAFSGSMLFSGELNVLRMIKGIVKDAVERKRSISLFMQPEHQFFYQMMSVVYEYPENSEITHIICLSTNPDPAECDNLEILKKILHSGIALKEYRPYYYYGIPSEHFGMMNMMPNFLILEDCTIQIGAEGKNAIVHKDPEINRCFQETFKKMLRLCYPLMNIEIGLDNRVTWGIHYTNNFHYDKTIEISSGLCSLQFWNRYLIESYLSPSISGYKTLLEGMVHYTAQLYKVKKNGQIKILMNPRFVLEFIKTGIFREFPLIYFASPLSKKDRKYLLKQIFQAMEEGWYHIYFLEDSIFPLDYRWEVVSHPNEKLYMQYCINEQFRIFEFEIPEVVNAVYDYLQSIIQSDSVMDEDASKEQMRKWMEEYL